MFAMLHGRWPRPSELEPGEATEALVASAVKAQLEAGLELVTDGQVRWPDPAAAVLRAVESDDTGPAGMLVQAWRTTAALPEAGGATVAAVVTGPCTLATLTGRPRDALDLARRLGGELVALGDAGCALVVVEEPAATAVGADEEARAWYRDAHRALLARTPGVHAMLAVGGGSAWEAGAETILDAPYRSYLFDLLAGPDNWYLVRAAPGERGIVCAALKAPSRGDQAPLLVWAAAYAASSNGRGPERVGLANGSSLEAVDEEAAREALRQLGRAARLATLEPEAAIAAGLDRRTFPRSRPPGAGRPRKGRSG